MEIPVLTGPAVQPRESQGYKVVSCVQADKGGVISHVEAWENPELVINAPRRQPSISLTVWEERGVVSGEYVEDFILAFIVAGDGARKVVA